MCVMPMEWAVLCWIVIHNNNLFNAVVVAVIVVVFDELLVSFLGEKEKSNYNYKRKGSRAMDVCSAYK